MRVLAVILVLLAGAVPAVLAGEEDPMAVQRCVWSCLANSPGASSPEYQQCVQRHCSGFEPPVPNPEAPSDWQGGIAGDGVHRYATTQAEQGYAFTYFCAPGQSFFVLGDLPVPPGQYRLVIGTVAYVVPFDMTRGALSVSIPPASPFMDGVRGGGDMLTVTDMQGAHMIRFSLRGADAAIGEAVRGCFG